MSSGTESNERRASLEGVSFAEWYPAGLRGSHSFDIGAIVYGTDGSLRIELRERRSGSDVWADLVFDSPLALRIVGEGSLMSYWKSGVRVRDHNLLIASRSRFLDWLELSSAGVHAAPDVKHFAVFSDDVCAEVLSTNEPSFTLR